MCIQHSWSCCQKYLFPVISSVFISCLVLLVLAHACNLNGCFLWHKGKTSGFIHSSSFWKRDICRPPESTDAVHVDILCSPALSSLFFTSAVTFPHFIYRNFSTIVDILMLFCKLSHKNLLTELASKPVNIVMHVSKGEALQYNCERQLHGHQTQKFILKQFKEMLKGLQ